MKWFRITSPGWQAAITSALVIFLGWDSMPVPGPDGRIAIELNELPSIYFKDYLAISLFLSVPGKLEGYDEIILQVPLVDHAPILRGISKVPNKPLQWVISQAPFVQKLVPKRYTDTMYGGMVMEISLTLDQWKRLHEARIKDDAQLVYTLHP
jgi:hypothetical protein